MQYTGNYDFILPEGTDKVSIEHINKNFTDIDGYLAEHQTSIGNLNKEIFVGGAGTLAFTVAENTTRLNELEANGGTGGVTPSLYVVNATSETVGNITWNIEKWNNGYARCWGDLLVETLSFSTTGATGLNIGFALAGLPTNTFTSKPTFASVMIDTTDSSGVCNVIVSGLDENYITLLVHRTDDSPTEAMTNVHFYIEVRGDASVG